MKEFLAKKNSKAEGLIIWLSNAKADAHEIFKSRPELLPNIRDQSFIASAKVIASVASRMLNCVEGETPSIDTPKYSEKQRTLPGMFPNICFQSLNYIHIY